MPPKKNPTKKPNDDDQDEDGDEGGDGGGGDDRPVTRAEMMKAINGAVSGQLARKLAPAIEAGMAPVLERLNTLAPKQAQNDDEDDGDDQGEDARPKPAKKSAAESKLERRTAALERELKEAREKNAKEEALRKSATIESTLTEHLTKVGVNPLQMRGALAVHKSSAFVDDAGKVRFKVQRDGYEEDLEPATALGEWAATDEGKSYLAPSGSSGGAGARAPRGNGPQGRAPKNTPEGKAIAVQEARGSLLSAVGELVAGGSITVE